MSEPLVWKSARLEELVSALRAEKVAFGALGRVAERLTKRWGVTVTKGSIRAALALHGYPTSSLLIGSAEASDVAVGGYGDPYGADPKEEEEREEFAAVDPRLIDFASQRQKEIIYAVLRHGSRSDAASALGVTPQIVDTALDAVTMVAARAGYSPKHSMTHMVPKGYHVKGTSTLYGKDGEQKIQWVKSQRNREYEYEMLVEAMKGLAEPFSGKSEETALPAITNADLLTVYPMGDPHLGLLSWPLETGQDFNLDIAERQLVSAVDKLVSLSPHSENALICNLGDFFHSDNSTNRTLRSGNALDVDTRWAKILSVGVRTMRRCIDRAADKHARVRVINEIGNHDDHSAIMLSLCLQQYYSNNPRIEIDTSPAMHHWYRFGRCMVGVTHGDKAKPQDLPGIMASDRARDWGETEHRYWYVGHIHHDRVKEYPGCIVENFRTLAARDAWHAGAGYRSGRDMKCDVLHKDHGRILRHTVGISMLEAA